MQLSEKEKSLLKRVVTDQAFDLFDEIKEELSKQWSKSPIQGETSFLVAQESIKRQERKNGIELFIKTIQELCL